MVNFQALMLGLLVTVSAFAENLGDPRWVESADWGVGLKLGSELLVEQADNGFTFARQDGIARGEIRVFEHYSVDGVRAALMQAVNANEAWSVLEDTCVMINDEKVQRLMLGYEDAVSKLQLRQLVYLFARDDAIYRFMFSAPLQHFDEQVVAMMAESVQIHDVAADMPGEILTKVASDEPSSQKAGSTELPSH